MRGELNIAADRRYPFLPAMAWQRPLTDFDDTIAFQHLDVAGDSTSVSL
jgi:hypothetical protein